MNEGLSKLYLEYDKLLNTNMRMPNATHLKNQLY
jgi:hypothetical protein